MHSIIIPIKKWAGFDRNSFLSLYIGLCKIMDHGLDKNDNLYVLILHVFQILGKYFFLNLNRNVQGLSDENSSNTDNAKNTYIYLQPRTFEWIWLRLYLKWIFISLSLFLFVQRVNLWNRNQTKIKFLRALKWKILALLHIKLLKSFDPWVAVHLSPSRSNKVVCI